MATKYPKIGASLRAAGLTDLQASDRSGIPLSSLRAIRYGTLVPVAERAEALLRVIREASAAAGVSCDLQLADIPHKSETVHLPGAP